MMKLEPQVGVAYGDRKNKDPEEAWQLEALPSSSSYDPVTDKGKQPQRGMAADVLVSFCPRFNHRPFCSSSLRFEISGY
jgi:hypothetical protein